MSTCTLYKCVAACAVAVTSVDTTTMWVRRSTRRVTSSCTNSPCTVVHKRTTPTAATNTEARIATTSYMPLSKPQTLPQVQCNAVKCRVLSVELITFAAHVGCGVHGGIDITATAQETAALLWHHSAHIHPHAGHIVRIGNDAD